MICRWVPPAAPALICSGNFLQTHWFHTGDWISMHLWWDGEKRQQTWLLSTQMDWQADASSACQVISTLAGLKWNPYAYLCLYTVTPPSFMCCSVAAPLRSFLRHRLSNPCSSVSPRDLSDGVPSFKGLLLNCLLQCDAGKGKSISSVL